MNTEYLALVAESCPDKQFMLSGFTHGFELGVSPEPDLRTATHSAKPATSKLMEKINSEVMKGNIVGPFQEKPLLDLFTSPLYVIPKPGSSKVRMIFDLSHPKNGSVNDNIDRARCSVRYCTVHEVGQLLLNMYGDGGAWLAKVDLRDAYRIVPIRKQDWRFLGLVANGEYYVDRMLPMGAASSCQIFQRISLGLKNMFLQSCNIEVHIFNYLDDFLLISPSRASCSEALGCFERFCAKLGVPISDHKTVRECKSLVFLGLGIDAASLTLYIPAEKQVKTLSKLERFLGSNPQRVKRWQSMVGSLNHLAQVIPAGRVYLSSLYGSVAGVLSRHAHSLRRISAEARQDLETWFSLLQAPPGRRFKVFDSSRSSWPPLFTDASSSVGYGITWGQQWAFGKWPVGRKCNIALLELFPVVLALLLLDGSTSDQALNVGTDNMALVAVLNSIYSKDAALRCLLKPIAQLCLSRNILIVASHVPGRVNIGPDLLSRGKIQDFRMLFPHMLPQPLAIPEELTTRVLDLVLWDE